MTHVRLGELLIAAGVLTEDKLAFALREQKRTGARLGRILVDARLVPPSDMVDALARSTGLARLDLGTVELEVERARQLCDWQTSKAEGIAPLGVAPGSKTLNVAVSDPTNVGPLDDLTFRSGLKVNPILGTSAEIDHLINHIYYSEPFDPEFSSRIRRNEAAVHDLLPDASELIRDNIGLLEEVQHYDSSPAPSSPIPTSPMGAEGGSSQTSLSDVFGPLLAQQHAAARELEVLFELCVERGLFPRERYLERVRELQDAPGNPDR